jgi:hypothetical protein
MKSNNALVGMSLMFLVFAVATSVVIWSDVSTAAKIAMFTFGYGAGVTGGTLIVRRSA